MSDVSKLDIGQLNGIGLPPGTVVFPKTRAQPGPENDPDRIDSKHVFRKANVKLIMFAMMTGSPVQLVGPTGSGKTTEVVQLLERLNTPYVVVSCHNDMEGADLFGYERVRANPQGAVDTIYVDGPVIRAMRCGIPVLLEERDSLPPTVNLALNNVLDGMGYTVPETGEHIDGEDGFVVFATANTAGSGDEGGQYVTSNVSSASSNNRWYTGTMDYLDAEQEVGVLMAIINNEDSRDSLESLVKFANATRSTATAGEMELAATTRELVMAARYSMFSGSLADAMDCAYFNKLNSVDHATAKKEWSLVFGTED